MDYLSQSPDSIFFMGVFGMFFGLTAISVLAHKFFH
jgi:hypothetical protein